VTVALVGFGILALVAYRRSVPVVPLNGSPDGDPGKSVSVTTPSHDGLLSAREIDQQQRAVRNQAVDWLRANNTRRDDSLSTYVASHIDRDLEQSEAFQLLLGPGLMKSRKATLLVGRAGTLHTLVGRAGTLHTFELDPTQARGISGGVVRVKNYSTRNDKRRAIPRVRLSDLVIEGAAHLFPEQPLQGVVTYRLIDRRPGNHALRLTFYFGKQKRHVLVPSEPFPENDEGFLSFSFPALADADRVVAGPDVVFIELVDLEAGQTIIESNAAAALVQVMPPEAKRPN
jgi:hypothetical protein